MKRKYVILCSGILAAGLGLGAIAYGHDGHDAKGDDKPVTIQGELIDTACFVTSDGDAKGKEHAACATKCMASGVPAGIVPDGKKATDMMYLLTNPVPLAPYAGQVIKIEGTAHADMHAVDVKKAYAKDGENWKEIQLHDEHHKMAGGAATDAHGDAHTDGHKDHVPAPATPK